MASANVDLVRAIYEHAERGDYNSAEWAHPEIEYVIADGPSPGKWTELAGMAQGTRSIVNAWEHFRVGVDEYRELDDERILVLLHASGCGKTSGLEVARLGMGGAALFHVRDGKVTRHVVYWSRERAFADLGLAPEADSP